MSLRGGDFLFDCGQDLAIGYHAHDVDSVHLYLVESLQLPRRDAGGGGRAAVALRRGRPAAQRPRVLCEIRSQLRIL